MEWGGLWHYVGRCLGHGGQVRDTQGYSGILEWKRTCPTARSSAGPRGHQNSRQAANLMLTPASEMPASSTHKREPQQTVARAGVASRSDSRYSRTKVWLNPRTRPRGPAGLSQAWQLWPPCGMMASCESSLAGVPLGWGCTHTACQEEGVARSEAGFMARLTQDTMTRRSLCHLLKHLLCARYTTPVTP